MARINIYTGSQANDGTGDDLRTAMQAINLNFIELYGATAEVNDLVEDGSPQLGGNLDLQTHIITTSASNGNITLTPNGTGNILLGTLRVDGSLISSDDSNRITLAESVLVSGTLEASTLNTNVISSVESSAIQIQDSVNISGTATAAGIVANDDNITIKRRWNDDSTRTTSIGKNGDTVGMIAWEDDHVYVCTADFDGSTAIWKRASLTGF